MKCPDCNGSGQMTCRICRGGGFTDELNAAYIASSNFPMLMPMHMPIPVALMPIRRICYTCKGSGKQSCICCGGTGEIPDGK